MTAELQRLFSEPVLSVTVLSPGYSGHASDVWQVQTASGICIVRSPRPGAAQDNPFWWGLRELFGTDPQRLGDLQTINSLLGRLGAFRVPQVKWVVGGPERSYAVLERVPGQMLDSFVGQGAELLTELGTGLARLHARKLDWWGHPSGRVRSGLSDFHPRLAAVMQALVERFYVGTEIGTALPGILAQLQQLPAPIFACPLMIDLDPSQFLSEGGRLGALVDTEAFVMAPPELDIVALEYLLDAAGADHFRHGYAQVRPLPPVSEVRTVYRFLYRLLEVQGDEDLDAWTQHRHLFA